MFGNNPIRAVEHDPASLAVQEIFYTIQGEGPYSGVPAVFIRLAGCNLACTYCDTDFESKIDNRLTIDQILAQVHKAGLDAKTMPRLVVLTGGEPMRQDLSHLVPALLKYGIETVQVETAGTLWQEVLRPYFYRGLVLVCSPKTPKISPLIARYCQHYKYVIRAGDMDHDDSLPSRGTQTRNSHLQHQLYRPWHDAEGSPPNGVTVWVSPCDEQNDTKNSENIQAACWAAMKHGYRLSLQVHKIVSLP